VRALNSRHNVLPVVHTTTARAMDWSHVTLAELLDALREVEWNIRPRPVGEFIQKLKLPKTRQQWLSRMKCNFFFYRTNYAIYSAILFIARFLWRPVVLIAFVLASLSVLILNDTFARQVNTMSTRAFGQALVNMRAKGTGGGSKQRSRGGILRIQAFTALFGVCVALLWLVSALWGTMLFLSGCVVLCCAHASSRSVSSKAKLANFRSEFRTAWRDGAA